jgi:hypothetical protein
MESIDHHARSRPSGSFCRNTVSVLPEQASASLRSAGGAFDQGSGSCGACVSRKSRRRSRSICQRKAGANGYIDGAISGRRRTGRCAVVRRLSKRVHRALTTALADAAGPTLGDMEFVALVLYSAMAGATRAGLEAGAPPKMVVRLHEELLVLCQEYAAKSVGSS